MMLYGYGDGGGGPDKNMLERAQRLVDCDGVPKILHATPNEFFAEVILFIHLLFDLFSYHLINKMFRFGFIQAP